MGKCGGSDALRAGSCDFNNDLCLNHKKGEVMKMKLDSKALEIITQMRSENVSFTEIAKRLKKLGYATKSGSLIDRNVYQFFYRSAKKSSLREIAKTPEQKLENKAVKPVDVANYVWHLLPDARKEAIIASVIGKELI